MTIQKATRDVVDLVTRPITQGIDIDGDGGGSFTIDGTNIGTVAPASAGFTDITMSGQINMGGNRISNVSAPAFGGDGVNRDYVNTEDTNTYNSALADANAYTDSQVGGIPPPPQQVPVGSVIAWPSSVPPSGWLLCDGSPVPGGEPALAAFLAPNFGPNLPDLRGRVIAMEDMGAGVMPTLPGPVGMVGGSEQQAAHTHGYSGTTSYVSSSADCEGGGGDREWINHSHTYSGTTGANSTGLGKIQPTMIMNWIIKT